MHLTNTLKAIFCKDDSLQDVKFKNRLLVEKIKIQFTRLSFVETLHLIKLLIPIRNSKETHNDFLTIKHFSKSPLPRANQFYRNVYCYKSIVKIVLFSSFVEPIPVTLNRGMIIFDGNREHLHQKIIFFLTSTYFFRMFQIILATQFVRPILNLLHRSYLTSL